MSVYLIAQLKIRPGHLEKFTKLMLEDIAPMLEPKGGRPGWKLLGSYLNVIGVPNSSVGGGQNMVLDVWEMTPDMSAFESVYAEMMKNPEYRAAEAELGKCVLEETMQFMYKLPLVGQHNAATQGDASAP